MYVSLFHAPGLAHWFRPEQCARWIILPVAFRSAAGANPISAAHQKTQSAPACSAERCLGNGGGGRILTRSRPPASRSTCSDLARRRRVGAHRPAFKAVLFGRRHVSFDPYNDAVLLARMLKGDEMLYLGMHAIFKSDILESIKNADFQDTSNIFWAFCDLTGTQVRFC